MASPFRRILAIVTLCFATAVPFTRAAEPRAPLPKLRHSAPARKQALVVPNVQGQAYVFAKGTLEDAGFAWRVTGGNGFAANTVVAQSPKAGTRVRDTGAPLITLTVVRNNSYPELGAPDNRAPYRGTAVRIARGKAAS
jgi:PASTA domain